MRTSQLHPGGRCVAYDREETSGLRWAKRCYGVSAELVAVSVPVPALSGSTAVKSGLVLCYWVSKVDAWFNGTEDRK